MAAHGGSEFTIQLKLMRSKPVAASIRHCRYSELSLFY